MNLGHGFSPILNANLNRIIDISSRITTIDIDDDRTINIDGKGGVIDIQ